MAIAKKNQVIRQTLIGLFIAIVSGLAVLFIWEKFFKDSHAQVVDESPTTMPKNTITVGHGSNSIIVGDNSKVETKGSIIQNADSAK